MNGITSETTLAEAERILGLGGERHALMDLRPSTWERVKDQPIGGLDGRHPAGTTARSLRLIEGLEGEGRLVVHDLWTADEVREDPERAGSKALFLPGDPTAPLVVVCDGGGYQSVCTALEALPFAARLHGAGYNVLVLTYRVRHEAMGARPVEDLAHAVSWARKEMPGKEFQYAMAGFSAGAHLVAELCTTNHGWRIWDLPRPDAAILCYPLLDLRTILPKRGEHVADGIISALLDPADLEGSAEDVSPVLHADATWPPTFLWQCADDDVVPIENLLGMRARLEELGVPVSSTVFPRGRHGLSGEHAATSERWPELAMAFLRMYL